MYDWHDSIDAAATVASLAEGLLCHALQKLVL
jgi:hypothetical protein